jgi:hypothetical protein
VVILWRCWRVLVKRCSEQFRCDRQKPAVEGMAVVFQEAREALDQTFLGRALARRMIGNGWQVGVFATGQSTDQGHQGSEMSGSSGVAGNSPVCLTCVTSSWPHL